MEDAVHAGWLQAQCHAHALAHALPCNQHPMPKRHHWIVRLTHWVNVVAVAVMVGSGLRIFNAYPAFARRGETFCCYPFAGHPIPAWLTFGGWLGGARHWHFAMMWILALNGLLYVGFIYLHGEWRDLVPRRGDLRDAIEMIKFYLFVRRRHPPQGKHNALQKTTYFAFPLLAALLILSGLAIWKPVQLAPLTTLLGGYVWARYWHFLAMTLLVALSLIHVFMVLTVDPYSLVSMVTGDYRPEWSPQRHDARPFYRRRATPSRPPSPPVAATAPDTTAEAISDATPEAISDGGPTAAPASPGADVDRALSPDLTPDAAPEPIDREDVAERSGNVDDAGPGPERESS